MTNHVTSTTGHDQSGQLPTLHAEESPSPACHAVAEDSAAHNEQEPCSGCARYAVGRGP